MTTDIGVDIYSAIGTTVPTYPVIAIDEAATPYAVYRRTGLTPVSSKDGSSVCYMHTYAIAIVDDDYSALVEKTASVVSCLLGMAYTTHDRYCVKAVHVENITEDFNEGLYIEDITVSITIKEK